LALSKNRVQKPSCKWIVEEPGASIGDCGKEEGSTGYACTSKVGHTQLCHDAGGQQEWPA